MKVQASVLARRCGYGLFVLILASALVSCSHTKGSSLPSVNAGEEGETVQVVTPPPPSIAAAVLPPIDRGNDVPVSVPSSDSESRFDVHVNDAPGAAFFLGLVENTKYSVVLHPSIAGEISLSLNNATMSEVLQTVADVYGYEIKRDSNRIYVMPPGLRTEIFELNYLNLDRRGQSQTWVSSGQISDKVSGDSGGSSNNTTTSGSSPKFNSGSSISTSNGSDIWSELVSSVASIIGRGEGRSVVTNPNAGLLVVHAMPWELRDVEEYLKRIESSLNRQVILEARILEVTLSDGYQAGINWSQLVDKDGFETTFS